MAKKWENGATGVKNTMKTFHVYFANLIGAARFS